MDFSVLNMSKYIQIKNPKLVYIGTVSYIEYHTESYCIYIDVPAESLRVMAIRAIQLTLPLAVPQGSPSDHLYGHLEMGRCHSDMDASDDPDGMSNHPPKH